MTRGRGKFKQKRGGGRTFSRNLVLNEDGIAVEADKWSRRDRGDDDDEDDEDENSDEKGKKIEESDEESEEEEEDQPEGAAAGPSVSVEQSRAERRAEKRQRKQPQAVAEEDQDLVNPNRLPVKAMAISDIAAPRELSRREREAKEKEEAKSRYWKLHQAGKTTEAKSDLARLAKIKQEREAAAKARKAEEEAKATTERG